MKSYYSHLSSTMEFGEKLQNNRKPILRSSAIFPVLKTKFISSRILFLGYWLLKRKIPEVNVIITLRDNFGNILLRKTEIISSVQSFSYEVNILLKEINFQKDYFSGSLEFEFQTTRDMVFPYPALVLEYYNDNFGTCVHTTQRIFNDFEDYFENQQYCVPESGFDIHCSKNLSPFMAFVNGPLKNINGQISYEITNHKSEKFLGNYSIGEIQSYETKFIKFNEIIDNLESILDNNSGSISISHNFEGFYPRFLAGNFQNDFPSISFTHSYYDCTNQNSQNDYWNRTDPNFFDSSVYIPLFYNNDRYTNLIIYPNFSQSEFLIDLLFYDSNGKLVNSINKFLNISSSNSKLVKINFNNLIKQYDIRNASSANIITNFKDKVPTRIKFGLDIGIKNKKSLLPCNICFNTKLGNPNILNKPGSFHWSPLFYKNSVIAIGNFSTLRNYDLSAKINVDFFREFDDETFSREYLISPNSDFRLTNDSEIKKFLQEKNGWITIRSDNPFIQGFYFNFYDSGSVEGDHLF